MFFTTQNKNAIPIENFRNKHILKANFIILTATFGTTEKQLDEYLKENYKTDLKKMCWKLLLNTRYAENEKHEVTITFKTPELDKIASIITYGEAKCVHGSNILREALK